MSITTKIRGAALVALLAGALPAPAYAQLGFIKKQLKEKIMHTVVDSALSKVAGQSGDSSATAASAAPTGLAGAALGLVHAAGAPKGSVAGPRQVEITPQSLDRLERFLTQAAQPAAPPQGRRKDAPPKANGADSKPAGDELTPLQYGLLTQRVVVFCAANDTSAAGRAIGLLAASAGMHNAYTPAEAAALRPRCGRLASLLGGGA